VYVQLNQTGNKEFLSLIRNVLQKTIGTFIAMVQRVLNSFQDDFFYVIFKIHICHISKYILIKCHETNHRIYCNSSVIIPLKLAGLAFEELEVFPAERPPIFF